MSVVAVVALVLSASIVAVRADEPPATPSRVVAIHRPAQRPSLSMDQAVRLAQHRFQARVVRAETQTQGGRTIYILRMLNDAGRVFAVRVDAASGNVL